MPASMQVKLLRFLPMAAISRSARARCAAPTG
ncbi:MULTISPECIES: sigma-54 factor interaction domain-containing protein [unclassified Novosphingobium]|nr:MULTISPECIES: sigma-54 factor interaction domain-containing protein [unclassified Novosphingobium]